MGVVIIVIMTKMIVKFINKDSNKCQHFWVNKEAWD